MVEFVPERDASGPNIILGSVTQLAHGELYWKSDTAMGDSRMSLRATLRDGTSVMSVAGTQNWSGDDWSFQAHLSLQVPFEVRLPQAARVTIEPKAGGFDSSKPFAPGEYDLDCAGHLSAGKS